MLAPMTATPQDPTSAATLQAVEVPVTLCDRARLGDFKVLHWAGSLPTDASGRWALPSGARGPRRVTGDLRGWPS